MPEDERRDKYSAAERSNEAFNRELLVNIYDEAARGNVQPLFDAMAPDFTAYECESLPWGGVYRGVEASTELVATIGRYCDLSTLSMDYFAVDRDIVIAYGSLEWRGENSESSVKIPLAEVYEIENRKLKSLRPFFWDTAALIGN